MKISSRTRVAAALALSAALAGCSDGGPPAEPRPPGGYGYQPPAVANPPPAQPLYSGITQVSDIYGSACDRLPKDGPGSVLAMRNQPVGTAVSNIPMLSTLARALQAADLEGLLNDPNASYTFLAPSNVAFDKLPPTELDKLLQDKPRLIRVLKYHIVPMRHNADNLSHTPQVKTLAGYDDLEISDKGGILSFDREERASTQCANIPTTNATMFIIDKVMMPA